MPLVWLTESLESYTGRLAKSSPRIARHMVNRITEDGWRRIVALTPHVTGTLRASIRPEFEHKNLPTQRMIQRAGKRPLFWRGKVVTDLPRAPYTEYDTGKYRTGKKYPIQAKPGKVLRFVSKSGKVIFTSRVMHPGSKGVKMFSRGAESAGRKTNVAKTVQPILMIWKAEFKVARIR